MILPYGTKTISQIKAIEDSTIQVREMSTLLEFLLKQKDPHVKSRNAKYIGLTQRVNKHKYLFTNVHNLKSAIQIRNDITHSKTQGLTHKKIEKAYCDLMEGVLDVTKVMPAKIKKAVLKENETIEKTSDQPDYFINAQNSVQKSSKKDQTPRFNYFRSTDFLQLRLRFATIIGILVCMIGLFFCFGNPVLRFFNIDYHAKTLQAKRMAWVHVRKMSTIENKKDFEKEIEQIHKMYDFSNEQFNQKTYQGCLNARQSYKLICQLCSEVEKKSKALAEHRRGLSKNFDTKNKSMTTTNMKTFVDTQKITHDTTAPDRKKKLKTIKRKYSKNRLFIKNMTHDSKKNTQKRPLFVDINKEFSPFLYKGHYVFGSRPAMHYKTARPVSYNNILRCGAMNSFQSFINEGVNQLNDRPVWKYPGSSTERNRLKQKFLYFQKMAKQWVYMDLLRP